MILKSLTFQSFPSANMFMIRRAKAFVLEKLLELEMLARLVELDIINVNFNTVFHCIISG